jgi:hypothetical protein
VATSSLPQTSTGAPAAVTEGTTTIGSATSPATTPLPPTTTSMTACAETKGMNEALKIRPDQVKSSVSPSTGTKPLDINPTTTTDGVSYPTPKPITNFTLDAPSTLTVVYVPTLRGDKPSNVVQFRLSFYYPDGRPTVTYLSTSRSDGASTTTTPSSGASSETTQAPTTSGVVLPSSSSPRVDLPPNFLVPQGTIVSIEILSTIDDANVQGVCTV